MYIWLVKLKIIGCNSARPTVLRHTTTQLLNIDEQYILLDCGEGTQIRLEEYALSHFRIHTIFISHLHGDHYFGLIGLLNTMGLAGREKPLRLIAPEGIMEILNAHLKPLTGDEFPFPIEYIPMAADETGAIKITNKISAFYFPTRHSIPTHGIRIEVQKPKYRILADKALALSIPKVYLGQMKEGKDYTRENGEVISFKEVTEEIEFQNYSYAYTADTAYYPEMKQWIEGVHTLYHESTYAEDRAERSQHYMHSTAKQAAEMAKLCGAQRLLLGHYSAAYKNTDIFVQEASEIFPNSIAAYDSLELFWPPREN